MWGLDRLAAAPQGSTVIITEGEFDCMLAEQETGCIGVSSTNGVKAFKPEWTNHFHGRHVVVMYDCDQEGREGVQSLILPAFKEAVDGGPGVVPQGGLALRHPGQGAQGPHRLDRQGRRLRRGLKEAHHRNPALHLPHRHQPPTPAY